MRRPFPSLARNAACLWLVLALFALKALVPPGFMPATGQRGTLIQLCSAAGTIWVAGPSKHSDAPDERHAAQAAACPLGAMLATVVLPSAAAPLLAVGAVMTHPLAARAPPAIHEGSPPGPPLGARAPPLSPVLR